MMDPEALRRLGFFSIQGSQSAAPVDPSLLTGTSAQLPSIWGTAGLGTDSNLTLSPSIAPTTLSLNPVTQPSLFNPLTTTSPNLGSTSRPVLPARGPRRRTGHERKRSRLSTEASTPLDSVNYWVDFDRDGSFGSLPEELEPPKRDVGKRSQPAVATQPPGYKPPQPSKPGLDEYADDSALDNALSDEEGLSSLNLTDQLSRIDTAPPQEVPPREGLYSTPLSWERPQPGLRPESLIGMNSPFLNEAEQRRLIAIAMNPGPSMGGLGSNINLNFSGLAPDMGMSFGAGLGGTDTSQRPKSVSPPHPSSAQTHSTPSKVPKKQGSVSEKVPDKAKAGERTAHNDIERKYRTNLKDKIAELRDAVPSLQTISEEGGEDDGTQPSRSAKISKGTVLTKATEYIHQLERRNKQIVQEHRELSRRLQAFEQLLQAAARQSYTMPTYSRTLFDPRGFC